MVTQQTRKVPNWKCSPPDRAHGYWLKNLSAIHERMTIEMDGIINNRMDIPK